MCTVPDPIRRVFDNGFNSFSDVTFAYTECSPQMEVLSLIKDGNSYQAIAEKLSMKYKTVVNVISTIRRKSGTHSLAELINFSMSIDI